MAVGDAHVFPGFLTPVLTQFSFPKPLTTFLTCFCRGERQNTPERKFASTGDRTHNHQVMSPTRSPLSHPKDKLGLLVRKGIYPYDYMDSPKKLKESRLPSKEAFYSKLEDDDITDEDYAHTQNVWKAFSMKTMRDYPQVDGDDNVNTH